MAEITEHPVHTLTEFVEIIDRLPNEPSNPCWFRGVGNADYPLLPTLYRHPSIVEQADLLQLEKKLIVRFKERSIPYLNISLKENWDYLFLMQHYGIPTRLLDWTENPMIALFFSLTRAKKNDDGYLHDAAVWVLSPALWNQFVFRHISYDGGPLSISDRQLMGYEPLSSVMAAPPSNPAAIFGVHNSPLIVAQRGTFTIFGSDVIPMQVNFTGNDFNNDTLMKIIIPVEVIESLLNKILTTGYTDSVIFPSLEGLASEMKRLFGFKV